MLPDCLDDLEWVVNDIQRQWESAICEGTGPVVVLCVGCFDTLHAGHVHLLREAHKEATYLGYHRGYHLQRKVRLVVALNTDESVRVLKGEERPVYSLAQRAFMLRAIRWVDSVVAFDGNPALPIHGLRPDLYVKGDDRTLDGLPERAVLEHYGSRIFLVPRMPGVSTTEVIGRLKAHGG